MRAWSRLPGRDGAAAAGQAGALCHAAEARSAGVPRARGPVFGGAGTHQMPPILPSIQCLGAFRRFMCFFGPRVILAAGWRAGAVQTRAAGVSGCASRCGAAAGRRQAPATMPDAHQLGAGDQEEGRTARSASRFFGVARRRLNYFAVGKATGTRSTLKRPAPFFCAAAPRQSADRHLIALTIVCPYCHNKRGRQNSSCRAPSAEIVSARVRWAARASSTGCRSAAPPRAPTRARGRTGWICAVPSAAWSRCARVVSPGRR